jgi:hypothetical protein
MSFAAIIAEVQESQAIAAERQHKAIQEQERKWQQEFEMRIIPILDELYGMAPDRFDVIKDTAYGVRRYAYIENIGFGLQGDKLYLCVKCPSCGTNVYSPLVPNYSTRIAAAKEKLVDALTKHPVEWGFDVIDGNRSDKTHVHASTCNQRWVMIDQRSGASVELCSYGESEEAAMRRGLQQLGYKVERRVKESAEADAKYPIPHPGFRAGQVWAAEDGASVSIVEFGASIWAGSAGRNWTKPDFALAYPYLIADPACPHLAPWSPAEEKCALSVFEYPAVLSILATKNSNDK